MQSESSGSEGDFPETASVPGQDMDHDPEIRQDGGRVISDRGVEYEVDGRKRVYLNSKRKGPTGCNRRWTKADIEAYATEACQPDPLPSTPAHERWVPYGTLTDFAQTLCQLTSRSACHF